MEKIDKIKVKITVLRNTRLKAKEKMYFAFLLLYDNLSIYELIPSGIATERKLAIAK